MQVFGKKISNWWLLGLSIILLVCSPVLLILFFAANSFAGAAIGPPVIWHRTWHSPPREDLVGRYRESERHWDQSKTGPEATLELRSDGSMSVRALPEEFRTTTCILSGTGKWNGPDEDQKLDLNLISDGSPGSCDSASYSLLELTGHSKPYGLYCVLGDPDSGTGIWLRKQ